jgi:flagellar basal-body rod protein FlgC
MDHFRASAISASGMLAQKARIEAAATNLANANSTHAAGDAGFQPVTAVIRSQPNAFSQVLAAGQEQLASVKAEIVAQAGVASRQAYEPGHPDADANGMVSYPGVDHAKEMLTVTTALRSYEANLAVLQATKTLATKALEIGGQ